jgi:Tfp pilus assembly protein PilF
MLRLVIAAVLAAGVAACGPIFPISKGADALDAGLRQYDEGAYAESARNLQAAIGQGLTDAERANAHKHLAFIHCAANRERACRDEFRKALAAEPALDLTPAEAGHPVWGPVFRAVRAGR